MIETYRKAGAAGPCLFELTKTCACSCPAILMEYYLLLQKIMKRLLYYFSLKITLLLFVSAAAFGQSFDNTPLSICNTPPGCQQEPLCTQFDDCFRFDYYGATDMGNGKSVLKFRITNYSEWTFKNAAFELPGNGTATNPASRPTNKFRNRFNHNVINPYQDSVIVYNAVNAGLFSYGNFEMYYYEVNTADLLAPSGRKAWVRARAGVNWQPQRTGLVQFDLDNCESKSCPTVVNDDCEKEDCCFNYALESSDVGADVGYFRPTFTLTKLCANDVISVSFSTNGATASGSNTTERTWAVNEAPNLVTFSSPGAPWTNTPGSDFESFFYQIPEASVTGPGATGRFVTVTITTATSTYSQIFDLLNGGPCGIIPLPVELVSFTGNPTAEGIALNWATASEKANDRFEVERSADGKNFEKIGTVKGNGFSSTTHNYRFLDARPLNELNYYRLKQVDFDATYAYSKIVMVKTKGRTEALAIALAPNPCTDQHCSVLLRGLETGSQVTVTLQDLTGRTVYSQVLAKDQTTFTLPKLNTGAGIYVLSVRNGNSTAYQRVILQQQ